MLDQIFAPIQYQIARFETRLEEIMTASDVGGIQEMAYHVVKNRGRRFRPALAFLTAQAVGECSDAVIDAAVGVEIIQTASLIHDDVLDNAETRRGADVLHLQWGNRAAILMGDFLFAKSMQVLVGLNSLPVMDATTHAIQRVVEGEILEGEISSSGEASLYFRMINQKTASLLALACELGAILGKGSPTQIARMASFGSEIGVAFQITDDVLDLMGSANSMGKPTGNDLREKKIDLALNSGTGKLQKRRSCPHSQQSTQRRGNRQRLARSSALCPALSRRRSRARRSAILCPIRSQKPERATHLQRARRARIGGSTRS